MNNPFFLNENYFPSEKSQLKSIKLSNFNKSKVLPIIDLQRESTNLYSLPNNITPKSPRNIYSSSPKSSLLKNSLEKSQKNSYLLDSKKLNVYKDQISQFSSILNSNEFTGKNDIRSLIFQKSTISTNYPYLERRYSLEREIKPKFNSNEVEKEFQLFQKPTTYTQKNNKSFKIQLNTINKMENLFKINDPFLSTDKNQIFNQSNVNNNHAFITEASILTAKNEEHRLNSILLRPHLITTIHLKRFTFEYFAIPIRNQEIPLKVNINIIETVESDEKKFKFKIYLSTKTRYPNKFNADLEYDVKINLIFIIYFYKSKGFVFYDSEKKRTVFKDEFLYFGLSSPFMVTVGVKALFGIKNTALEGKKLDYSPLKIQNNGNPGKNKSRNSQHEFFNLDNVPREMLYAQISK